MAKQWPVDDGTFHLGINMAGAVSAGAYTAGVLDFLMEALEEWHAAKAVPNPAVPLHKISIDVFSGASAGGMCAAIAAAMVQSPFQHIHNPEDCSVKDTSNKFYESWVNKIDIEPLLQDADLTDGSSVVSLLDSTIIDEIADYALTPGPLEPRSYISDSLTLFLTLTNVRGTPFSLNGNSQGSAEEDIRYYADRLQFETVQGVEAKPHFPLAKPLPVGSNAGAWPLLKEAAKATGAFPLFLAPRRLDRNVEDYLNSPWEAIADPLPAHVPPHWPLPEDGVFSTLNVDGGVTNNDPFQLAHDYLAVHNPLVIRDQRTGNLANPREADTANCAVLTVAPFPSRELYQPEFNFAANSSLLGMLPNLFTALVSQSRFQGESLTAVMNTTYYSRFVLAPSDAGRPDQDALQCGILSAFGGFFERGFRAHDYQLGRRNCQKFLRDTFRLSVDNPIIKAGFDKLDNPETVTGDFAGSKPGTVPIIPLCGTAVPEVPVPVRATISSARVGHILNWIIDRLHAVSKPLVEDAMGPGFDAWAARAALDTVISTWGRARLREVLQEQLKDVIAD